MMKAFREFKPLCRKPFLLNAGWSIAASTSERPDLTVRLNKWLRHFTSVTNSQKVLADSFIPATEEVR